MSKTKIKKYPIIHEGKEYEIRWEGSMFRDISWDYISLYKVSQTLFGFKKYTKVYSQTEDEVICEIVMKNVSMERTDPMYYVYQAKYVFNEYLRMQKVLHEKKRTKQAQLEALQNWDGIIQDESVTDEVTK